MCISFLGIKEWKNLTDECKQRRKHKSVKKDITISSNHCLYSLFLEVSQGGWFRCDHRARGGVNPGRVASPSQGSTETHRTKNQAHTLIPTGNLQTPINLTVMVLGCGRKPEYTGRTHACTGRTCKLHAERAQDLLAASQQWYQLSHHAALMQNTYFRHKYKGEELYFNPGQ
ncbi:hypothetical protein AMECASPLE_019573 [Ameca splendens]|uniref:Uncharacterized protein n=1 Tax=Ameca splendens TaxID=208324 RepID=A0ABV0XS13_9TELE